MKIGILGSRGIPNQYGGFEECAEQLAARLVKKGHAVTVYSSHTHPIKVNSWKGVRIARIWDPEKQLGTAGQFIYDFFGILDSHKRNYDIILQLGYTSSGIWQAFLPRKSRIVTNMDGLEWKRAKYSKTVQQFLKITQLNESHRVSSIAWDKFYSNIKIELAKHPTERIDPKQMLKISKEEFDRLIETSPNIPEQIIQQFKTRFFKN